MRTKRCTIFFFFLMVCTLFIYGAQHHTAGPQYLDIEATGLPGGQVKETNQGKLVNIYTAGGFLSIQPALGFNKQFHKLHYLSGNRDGETKSQVYLYPGRKLVIDILDRQTDTLLKRYLISRPKLVPEIRLHLRAGGNDIPINTSATLGPDAGGLKISPGEAAGLTIIKRPDFADLEVEYTLLNLKTKTAQHKMTKKGFETLVLEANTEYELRINYTIQKESAGIAFLSVKAYWYQSPLMYIILLLVLLVLGFVWITKGLKNKIKASQREQRKMEESAIRLQALLNPHFTFNALSSIQGLINTDRIEEANLYLQEFSSLLRATLAKSQHVFNSLDQELEMMRMYIKLEALRFNFTWTIEISDRLHTSEIEIPTLLFQPIIENSVKHGLSRVNDKAHLRIICKEGEEKDTFVIIVKDNGTWNDKISASGYGLSLTGQRIKAINKMRNEEAIVLHFNTEWGTEAVLTFHNWINN